MRRIILGMLAAASMMLAADIDGVWEGPVDLKNGNGQQVVLHMRLKQDGEKLSGGVWAEEHDEDSPRPIQNGTVSGNRLTFDVPQKADFVVKFDLIAESDGLNGTVKFQGDNGAQEMKIALKRRP